MAMFIIAPRGSLLIKEGTVVITGARAFHSLSVAQLAADHARKVSGQHYDIIRLETVGTTSTIDEELQHEEIAD